MGALAYADDLTLLCPSLHGLRSMLSTCESFGKEFDVKFNPKKSECILFQRKSVSQELVQHLIYLDGIRVT